MITMQSLLPLPRSSAARIAGRFYSARLKVLRRIRLAGRCKVTRAAQRWCLSCAPVLSKTCCRHRSTLTLATHTLGPGRAFLRGCPRSPRRSFFFGLSGIVFAPSFSRYALGLRPRNSNRPASHAHPASAPASLMPSTMPTTCTSCLKASMTLVRSLGH